MPACTDTLADKVLDTHLAEITDHLVHGDSEMAAEGFEWLANYYARAGLPIAAFYGMRQVIIGDAINQTGYPGFITAKLQEVEKIRAFTRNNHRIDNLVKH